MLKSKSNSHSRNDSFNLCWILILLFMVGFVSFMGSLLGALFAREIYNVGWGGSPATATKSSGQVSPGPDEMLVDPKTPVVSDSTQEQLSIVKTTSSSDAPSSSSSSLVFDLDKRVRNYWESITKAICVQRNYSSCRSADRSTWTDAEKSVLSAFELSGLGYWSTFKLATYDKSGRKKSVGGDHWVIELRDNAQKIRVPGRVFDDGDGTYTVAVHIHLPGEYGVWAWLWYSNCLGYQEPSEDVESIFKHHSEFFGGFKKPDHCYIGQRLRVPANGQFDVSDTAHKSICLKLKCSPSAVAYAPDIKASKTFHTWRSETYHSYKNHSYISWPCCKPRLPVRKAKDKVPQRLLFLGDSTVFHSWDILVQATRRPCKVTWPVPPQPTLNAEHLFPDACPAVKTFAEMDPDLDPILKRCTKGMPWTTVPIGADTPGSARNSKFPLYVDMKNFQYNDTYARIHDPPVQLPLPINYTVVYLEHGTIRSILGLSDSLMSTTSTDVVVLTMGPHYSRLMQFEAWKTFVNELAVLLTSIKAKTGALMVWRTSFLVKENALRSYETHGDKGYVDTAHFNTDARRLLFESYAEYAMEKIGVHVWDVYGLSAVGGYRPADMFHAGGPSTWAQNTDMMDLFGCKA